MHCHKVQQFTGSKKCHYCILSRETDRQWRKWIKFMQFKHWRWLHPASTTRPLLCDDHFVDSKFLDFMEYKMGFAANLLPERILESTAVLSIHKVSKQLAQLGTVTNTIITTASVRQCHHHLWSSCCRDLHRDREKTTNTGNKESFLRFVLGFLISFSVKFYEVKSWR